MAAAAVPIKLSSEVRAELRRVITALDSSSSSAAWPTPDQHRAFRLFMADGVSVALVDDEADAYSKCIEMLAPEDQDRPSAISPRQIVQLVNQAIVGAIKPEATAAPLEQRIKNAIQQLESRLATTPRLIKVVVPVAGIRLPSGNRRDVRVAGVAFRSSQRLLRGRLIRRDSHGEMFRKIASEIPNVAWAQTSVKAVDGEAARSLATYQTQLALDIINFYAGRLGAASGAAVYLPGVRQLLKTVSAAHVVGDPTTRQDSFDTSGPWWIEVKPMNHFRAYRRVRRLVLSSTGRLNDAEQRALAALRWIGRGAVSPWREQAFLDFVIALESLLLGKERLNTWQLKMRAACLLAGSRKHRQRIFDTVSGSYAIRNQIAHSGSFEVTDQQLHTARAYATIGLLKALGNSQFMALGTGKAIDQWWNHQTLTGTTPTRP
jgi:hypothetical protein